MRMNIPYDAHVGLSGVINFADDEAPFDLIIGVYELLYIASMIFVMMGAATGRIGGRLTGWQRQRRMAPGANGAAV